MEPSMHIDEEKMENILVRPFLTQLHNWELRCILHIKNIETYNCSSRTDIFVFLFTYRKQKHLEQIGQIGKKKTILAKSFNVTKRKIPPE